MSASPNGTVVTALGQSITDASGEVWTITTGGQVAVNGTADPVTGGVKELAYISGFVWQLNTFGNWYAKGKSSDSWAGPTKTSPIVPTQSPVSTPTPAPSYEFSLDFSPQFDGLINAPTPSPTVTATPSPTPVPITHAALQARLDQAIALLTGIRADLAQLSP